jgi:hypothetical protein
MHSAQIFVVPDGTAWIVRRGNGETFGWHDDQDDAISMGRAIARDEGVSFFFLGEFANGHLSAFCELRPR